MVAESTSSGQRLLDEARAVAALDHPNICTVFDIGESADGRAYVAMAYYDGETLDRQVSRGPLPIDRTLDIVIQAGQGLAAHQAGVVHRDSKPANLMYTRDGQVTLLDFGLAKTTDSATTTQAIGTRLETVGYMSPEQARNDLVDGRTDIWALGVVLYELVAGQPPFGGAADAILYPVYDSLRDDPRFGKLLRSMRLPLGNPAAVTSVEPFGG